MTAAGGDQVVLVVGASSGIGRATAHAYAARGAHLVLASRSRDALEEAARECLDRGAASATVEVLDVGDGPAVTSAVDRVVAEHGRVDVCVHSAALIAFGEFHHVPPAVFDHVVTTNVLGTANVARAVLPGMRERDAGVLVVIGSVLGRISVPQLITYWHGQVGGARPDPDAVAVECATAGASAWSASPPVPPTPRSTRRRPTSPAGRPGRRSSSPAREGGPGVLRAADGRRRGEALVGLANPVMVLGRELLPAVFDVLVGPLMGLLALTREPMAPHPGNVLSPVSDGEATHGPWSGAGLLGLDRRRR